jgi:peptidoglycan/LPS O-acetylase OafA/YrhL
MTRTLRFLTSLLRPEKSRQIQLDVLRGTAILLVLAEHHMMNRAGVLQGLANLLYRFGWTGVDLFFVLSGFLVGGLLFKEIRSRSSLDVGRFIIRRGFKIWPGFFIYLFFLGLYLINSHGFFRSIEMLFPYILQFQNYFITLSIAEHTWSLAVEEHFYLFLPLLLYLIITRMKRGGGRVTSMPLVPIVAISLIIFCTLARYLTFISIGKDAWWVVWYPTHLRMDSLFFGVLIAYLHYYQNDFIKKITQHRLLILLGGVALISPMMVVDWQDSLFVFTIGFTMLYLGYGCILLAVVDTSTTSGWYNNAFKSILARTIGFIGYFSYSIYLWHYDVAPFVVHNLFKFSAFRGMPQSIVWLISFVCFIFSSIIVGVVMGVIVERPALALRDRFFPSRISSA